MSLNHPHLRWHDGNAVTLLENGQELFPALCEAFDAAHTSIHLETYIFKLDAAGLKVLDHLKRAAERGVKVRVVLDGYGSARDDRTIQSLLRAVGAQCRIYRPEPKYLSYRSFDFLRLRRMHRKTTLVDNHLAFIGGINIEDDYSGLSEEELAATQKPNEPRFDYAVRLTGPLAIELMRAQDLLWLQIGWPLSNEALYDDTSIKAPVTLKQWKHRHVRRLRLRLLRFKHAAYARNRLPHAHAGTMRAALVLRDNLRYRRAIEAAYFAHIANAHHEIVIANAYFLPGMKLRHALIEAAARGVRVRLLLQGKIEYRMQYHATRWIYQQFLKSGIEIYEYLPSYLHAKVAVIDGVSVVGSSNLDPFSLLLARETNIVVDDAGFTSTLRRSLEKAFAQGSQIVEPSLYHERSLLARALDACAYLLLRVGVALSGKGAQY
jgi:cardiolipin synthase A/B